MTTSFVSFFVNLAYVRLGPLYVIEVDELNHIKLFSTILILMYIINKNGLKQKLQRAQ